MSTIQANAILDASGGNTTTINGVTPNTDSVRGRNLIINGAMQVAQRGTSAVAATNSAYFGPDRFKYFLNGGGAYTVAQDTGHLAATGHDKAIKIAVTTADTSIAAGDYYSFLQRIEAKNIQHLQWGTASAKSLTLSFWVRATKTGTQALHFAKQGSGTDYRYVAEYTISASDTWEYKTITVTGLTADTIVDDSSTYLQVGWMLKYGSDFQGTKDVWTTSAIYTTSAAVNHMDSTSNTFYITGVKLEVGSVATGFDHRSYGEELQLCKRYYQLVESASGMSVATTAAQFNVPFSVEMRSSPTVSISDANGVTSARVTDHAYADTTITSGAVISLSNVSKYGSRTQISGFTGLTTGRFVGFLPGASYSSFMRFDAEL